MRDADELSDPVRIGLQFARPWRCIAPMVGQDFGEKGRWLARNVLPHERLIRARLGRCHVYGLEVDDVIQEMYARIVSLPSLESIKYPRQYAIQTAIAIVIDYVRRSRIISINSGGLLEKLQIASGEASPEEQMEFREEIAQIEQFLACLPRTTRETLILRRIEGLSQQQTADRLGVSVKTVEKHMARGVSMLIEMFGKGGKFRLRSSKGAEFDFDDNEEAAASTD